MQWMQDGEKYSIYLSGISRRDKRLVNWETTRLLIPGFSSLSLTSPFIRASTLKGYNLINYSFQWNFTEMYINYVLNPTALIFYRIQNKSSNNLYTYINMYSIKSYQAE